MTDTLCGMPCGIRDYDSYSRHMRSWCNSGCAASGFARTLPTRCKLCKSQSRLYFVGPRGFKGETVFPRGFSCTCTITQGWELRNMNPAL